jgi:hypothetical protein
MFFRSPVKLVKVSIQLLTVDGGCAVVTICAEGYIVRHVGSIVGAISLGFMVCSPIVVGSQVGVGTSITVHPLGRDRTIYTPITVMGVGKGDWGSSVTSNRIIMPLSLMLVMTSLARVNLGQHVAKSPPALQEIPNRCQVMCRAVIRTADVRPRIAVFLNKIKGLSYMARTAIWAPAELMAVTALVRHGHLC